MPPAKLFKYGCFDDDGYALANITNSTLRFSAPISFNDPFDCALTVHKRLLNDDDFARAFALESARRPVTKLFGATGDTHAGFRVAITRAVDDAFRDQRDNHLYKRGVSCFAEKADNLLMWAHYADSHRGFCLEFDAAIEPFAKARPVAYEPNVPELNPVDLLDPGVASNGRFEQAMLRTKSTCWSYEEEWRLVHEAADVSLPYRRTALIAVYLGCNASGKAATALVALAKSRSIAAFKMERVPGTFGLKPTPL